MRIKSMPIALAIVALVAIIAMPALAQEKPAKKMDIQTFLATNQLHGPSLTRDYFEGFESGALPLTWAQTITNIERTWDVSDGTSTGSLEGDYCAFVGYDLTVYQDETISFDQYVDVAGGEYVLSFFMAGAKDTDWDFNVAETVEINGTQVWDFDSNVTAHMTYEKYFIDLSAYDGQTITITFRYAGVDGDLHVLDAVMVDDGTGYEYIPPPPPEVPDNDTCEMAFDNGFEIMPGAFSFSADNTLANNDYNMAYPSCTGYSFSGLDLVWYVCLDQGDILDVTMTCGFDNAIFILSDCADPESSCVVGADATTSGVEEILGFVAPADGMYYVVAGGYSSSGVGTFTLSGTNYGDGCIVATESTSFDSLKSMYR